MKVIRPEYVTPLTLFQSNIRETAPAAYDVGTTYDEGDYAGDYDGTTVAVYRSLQNGNLGNSLGDTDWWEPYGTTYANWNSTDAYAEGARVLKPLHHKVYESATIGNVAMVWISVASPAVITAAEDMGVESGTPVYFGTDGGGTLPTGITAGTVYYVLNLVTDGFTISATPGGTAVITTAPGSGLNFINVEPNIDKDPTDPDNSAYWLYVGPSNKFAMFDDINGTVTAHPIEIDFTVQEPSYIDSIVLFALDHATSVQVIVTSATDGEVYNETLSTIETATVTNWFEYFFSEVQTKDSITIAGLPLYSDKFIQVIITGWGDGTDVQCGSYVQGLSFSAGTTLTGPGIGIVDYSRNEADAFGTMTFVERPYSRRGDFEVILQRAARPGVQRVLEDLRATPAAWIPDDDDDSLNIFGWARDFKFTIDNSEMTKLSLQLEGIT